MSTRTFDTLPAHESIVARACNITGKKKGDAGRMSAIFTEAETTRFPKNHDVIDVALRSMRRRLVRAKVIGPDVGKKRMNRISLKLAAERAQEAAKAVEKVKNDDAHASNGVATDGLTLEAVFRNGLVELGKIVQADENLPNTSSLATTDAESAFTASAMMFSDADKMPTLVDPSAMADVFDLVSARFDKAGAAYDPDAVISAIVNLRQQAAKRTGGMPLRVESGDAIGAPVLASEQSADAAFGGDPAHDRVYARR